MTDYPLKIEKTFQIRRKQTKLLLKIKYNYFTTKLKIEEYNMKYRK